MSAHESPPVPPSLQERAERLSSDLFIGGPVEDFEAVGRLQLEVLIREGLRPSSRVLDIGCGALRAGYWLMHFLDPGKYHGVEPNQEMLRAGIDHILEPGLMEVARPAFRTDEDFDFAAFGQAFDYFLARSIWTHASRSQITTMLDGFLRASLPSSVFLTSYLPAGLVPVLSERLAPWEELGASLSLAARRPHLVPRAPRWVTAKWEYLGDGWIGRSHRSSQPGVVRHSFAWIREECTRRGLRVRELGYGVANHQRWLRIERG